MLIVFDGTIWGGQETGVSAATRRLFVQLTEKPSGHRLTAIVSRRTEPPIELAGRARGVDLGTIPIGTHLDHFAGSETLPVRTHWDRAAGRETLPARTHWDRAAGSETLPARTHLDPAAGSETLPAGTHLDRAAGSETLPAGTHWDRGSEALPAGMESKCGVGTETAAVRKRLDRTVELEIVPARTRGRRVLWQQLDLPRMVRRLRADLLYCPCYTVPIRSRTPSVVTVHDLIAWKRPDLCRWLNVLHFRSLVGASVRRARRITVPTETVKRDLIEILRIREEKIRVVPWGVDLEIRPVERDLARRLVSRWYGIEGPFVLFVGGLEPKKNLSTLLLAMRALDVRLVVAGPSGWGERKTRRLLEAAGRNRCLHLGYVPVDRLGPLYSAADVFAFPSLIEGFGLPAVEAMACGAPVVASDAEALREVCGGAALHAPALDAAAWSEALRALLGDAQLQDRMIRAGRARAAEFTWDRTASLFLAAAQEAVSL